LSGAGRIGLATAFLVLCGAAAFAQTESRRIPQTIHCLACPAKDREAAPEPPRHTIMTQRVDAFDAWLTHLAGARPIVIQTHRANLIAVLDDGPVDDLTAAEIAYLRSVFPKLPAAPKSLDAHQAAHVLALRLARMQSDMAEVLDLDGSALVKREAGPGQPVSASHVDVCVLSKPSAYDAFVAFRFAPGSWPLEGAVFDRVPTGAALVPNLKDAAAARQFAFTSAMQLLRKLARDDPGLQPWLQVGLAHAFEERAFNAGPRPWPSGTIPPELEEPKDWEAFVADLVTAGKSGDLGAMAATPRHGLSVRSRLQAWSMARWLIAKDPKAFAAFVRRLLHAAPGDPPAKLLLGAVRAALGHDLVSLVTDWEATVKKARAAAR
jgi:hypothetical protein